MSTSRRGFLKAALAFAAAAVVPAVPALADKLYEGRLYIYPELPSPIPPGGWCPTCHCVGTECRGNGWHNIYAPASDLSARKLRETRDALREKYSEPGHDTATELAQIDSALRSKAAAAHHKMFERVFQNLRRDAQSPFREFPDE